MILFSNVCNISAYSAPSALEALSTHPYLTDVIGNEIITPSDIQRSIELQSNNFWYVVGKVLRSKWEACKDFGCTISHSLRSMQLRTRKPKEEDEPGATLVKTPAEKIIDPVTIAPDSAPVVYSMHEFHRIGDKPVGLSQGGLYQNALGEKWFLKMVDPRWPFIPIRATIATHMARFFLGEFAPIPILVLNESNHDLLTGSHQIKGYEELRSMSAPVISNECRGDYLQDDLILHRINGKIIANYQNVVSFVSFICDSDFLRNVGLVQQQDHYVTAKVDYDGAFAYGSGCDDDPMNDMNQWFNRHFPGNSLICHGFQNFKHAVDKIANTPWETIDSLIFNATQSVEKAISKTSKTSYQDELNIFKTRTIKKIKVRHDKFRELSSKMRL